MSGLSETAVSNELQGRVDMDVGARDVVGGAIERTKGERAAWVMAAQTASQPSITIPDFDWSGLPQVIGGYNYNWDDYYNQYGGGGYDDPYGGEVPPTILTADEQAAQSTGTFFTGQPYSGPAEEGSLEHYAWDRAAGASVHQSYAHWLFDRLVYYDDAPVPNTPDTIEAIEMWMNLWEWDENGEVVLDEEGQRVFRSDITDQEIKDAENFKEEAVQELVEYRSDEDIAAWVDPFGHTAEDGGQVAWETQTEEVQAMFGGSWRKWEEQRRMEEQMGHDEFLAAQQQGQQALHDAYVDAVSQQGAAAALSQQQQQQQRRQREEEERYEDREQREEREEEDIGAAYKSRENKDIWGGGLGEMSREEFEAAYGHRYR
jgi:hypothetical protein